MFTKTLKNAHLQFHEVVHRHVGKLGWPMVDVSDSETRKCRVHVSECVTRK